MNRMSRIAPYERIDYEDTKTGLIVITDTRDDSVSVEVSDYAKTPTRIIARGHRDTGWMIRVFTGRDLDDVICSSQPQP